MVFSQIFHADDHHPARIRNVDKDYARELGFQNIKLLVKIKNIRKIKKKIGSVLMLLTMKIGENIQSIYRKN